MTNNKPVCILQSPMWTRSGYGDLGMAIAKSLYRYDKFDLRLIPTRWGGCNRKYLSDEITNPIEKILFSKIIREPLTKQPEIFIQCTIPNEYQAPAKFNIGITAGIETTLARPDWIEGLNRMNWNIVTSKHAKDVFESATYNKPADQHGPASSLKSLKPIDVLFWGANTEIYHKTDQIENTIEQELSIIPELFCFLFVGQWTNNGLFTDRKDIGNLIKTFMVTFANYGNKPKPALIVKTSGAAICNMDKHDIISRLKAIKEIVQREFNTKDLPNVYLLHGELTDKEMNSLYNHEKVKAHISFTHGEGYGMPILESTLSGKPVLVSNWSGHLDFLDGKLCKLLDGDIKPLSSDCVNDWLIKESAWFNINYKKAAETMSHVYYNYTSYLDKAEQLRLRNKEMFSMESMDKKFHEMLDKNIPTFATETKLILPKLKKVS